MTRIPLCRATLSLAALILIILAGPSPTDAAETGSSREDVSGAETDVLGAFVWRRHRRNQRAMQTLGGWALANIGVGTARALATEGSRRHFWSMNAMWNGINAIIAAVGYAGTLDTDLETRNRLEILDESHRLEKVLLFNMGLNVAYVAGGALLWERGRRLDSDRLAGWGPAVALQGAFLMLFDTTLWWTTRHQRRELEVKIAPRLAQPGLGIDIRF